MRKIIIDTNFLMIPFQFRVDIFSEIDRLCNFAYKLYIFSASIGELESIIKNQKGKSKRAAQFALKLANLKKIGIIDAKGSDVDGLILENCGDAIIATQDRELKRKLAEKKASIIILRQKNHLELIERKLYK